MAATIRRGVLMLVGGAISDCLPKAANILLSSLLTLLLLSNACHLYGIVLISGRFGLSEAFLSPATLALLPSPRLYFFNQSIYA